MGHIVGNGVLKPQVDKVEAIHKFPEPVNKKGVWSILGLAGYHRKFIPDYASRAVTLTDLTKKSAPNQIQWTPDRELGFQDLKSALSSDPVLKAPDISKMFTLQTDASEKGVGAVLSQSDNAGEDHPIAYFSRKLLPREEKYFTVEKECLAIKLGIQVFRTYLLAKQFTIKTDH